VYNGKVHEVLREEGSMKEKIKKIWNSFTLYEKIWFFSVVVLTIIVAIFFPSTVDNLEVNPTIIMGLYVADVFTNVLCELLISKQSKWNFIVSLFVEVIEITTCLVIRERFATMATTLFFWIPIDIISFINWNRHMDKKDESLTVVRTLKGYQEILIILAILVWTVGVGFLLTKIDAEGILEAGSVAEKVACYLDAMVSAVAVCNGVFILLRLKEQWIAWYIDAALEIVLNIMMGQWVLLVLKAAYISNTTYGYIKWTEYIKTHHTEIETKKQKLEESKKETTSTSSINEK
jgi:nicotinamide mononucleotide transporter